MSVFSTYVFILIIILLVYYAIVILWEIKRPRTSDDKTHDDIAGDDANVFGYTKMYVIENPSLDGTFCVSEDENYYFATDYDESLEETGDSPEEICLDDQREASIRNSFVRQTTAPSALRRCWPG